MKIIKLGLVTVFVLLFTQVLIAQNSSNKFSFRAGLNSAQLDFGGFNQLLDLISALHMSYSILVIK
jgi:hypothetical protein